MTHRLGLIDHPGPGPSPNPLTYYYTDNKGGGPTSLGKGEGHLLVVGSEFGAARIPDDR